VESTDFNQYIVPIKNGDVKAFRALFDQMHPMLVRHLLKLTQQAELSEELANDIFISFWKNRQKVEINTSLKAYLYRAATNKAYDFYRKKERQPLVISMENQLNESNAINSVEEKLNYTETERRILNCVSKLPERCRLVFSLSRFSQYPRKQIAAELDISIKTIENQITKAMKLMKSCLFDKPAS